MTTAAAPRPATTGFDAALGTERGQRHFQERADRKLYGPRHREVRALAARAAAVEQLPGYVASGGGRGYRGTTRCQAFDYVMDAGYNLYIADALRDLAADSLREHRNQRAQKPLEDALFATALEDLLPADLYGRLMCDWWRALDDNRWVAHAGN